MTSRSTLGGAGVPGKPSVPGKPREPVAAGSLPVPDSLSGADVLAGPYAVPSEPGWLVIADELPDGLVVADEAGRIAVFNAAASRLTDVDPAEALGKDLYDVLPLHDADGRDWWACTDPYHGLQIRTRHPERPLYLRDGTEVLVVVRYIRERRRHDVGAKAAQELVGTQPGLGEQLEHGSVELHDVLVAVADHEPGGVR